MQLRRNDDSLITIIDRSVIIGNAILPAIVADPLDAGEESIMLGFPKIELQNT